MLTQKLEEAGRPKCSKTAVSDGKPSRLRKLCQVGDTETSVLEDKPWKCINGVS